MIIKLKKILEEKNISLYELSNKIDVSYQSLHPLANNKTSAIKFDTLEKICKALNCNVNDILEIE